MAVSAFTTAATAELSDFKAFIDAKKDGTFLEGKTVALSESETANDTLTISDGKSNVIIRCAALKNGLTTDNNKMSIVSHTTGSKTAGMIYARKTSSPYSECTLYGALLCGHGLIVYLKVINWYANSGSTHGYDYTYFMVTEDNEGGLAIVYDLSDITEGSTSGTVPSVWNTGFRVATNDFISEGSVSSVTSFGCQRTGIVPIIPHSVDDTKTLPYAFTAVQTQLAGGGLAECVIGSDTYITNGYWYVKD